MYIPVDKVVVVTQHVQSVEEPQDDQAGRKTCPDPVQRQEEPVHDHQAGARDHRDIVNDRKKVQKGRKQT